MKKLFLILATSFLLCGCSVVEEYGRGTLEKPNVDFYSDETMDFFHGEDEINNPGGTDETAPKQEKNSIFVKTKEEKKDKETHEVKTKDEKTKRDLEDEKIKTDKKDNIKESNENKTDEKDLDKKDSTEETKIITEDKEIKDAASIVENSQKKPADVKNTVKSGKGVDESLSNKSNGWWFTPKKAGTNGKSTIPADTQKLLESYGGIWQQNTSDKVIYLTFDEGYEFNNNTAKILDVLKEKQVQATFFITGAYLKQNLDLVNRMINEGHVVGNHSNKHLNQVKAIENGTLAEDITSLEDMYAEKTGAKISNFLRPPEGVYSERTLAFIKDQGYRPVFWSFAYKDWLTDAQPKETDALKKIVEQFHPGEVMLLHAVSNTNANILSKIIDKAWAEGYSFGSLNDI